MKRAQARDARYGRDVGTVKTCNGDLKKVHKTSVFGVGINWHILDWYDIYIYIITIIIVIIIIVGVFCF